MIKSLKASHVPSTGVTVQCWLLQLQFGENSVSTKDLTKSFGWDTMDSFMQHDVQELNRVLCDNLEEKMKVSCTVARPVMLFATSVSRVARDETPAVAVCAGTVVLAMHFLGLARHFVSFKPVKFENQCHALCHALLQCPGGLQGEAWKNAACSGHAPKACHAAQRLVRLQNTKVQGAINHLFEGHTFNYVECINVDYKSTRKESYMDLQLDVKGCKNVYESFAKYTEVEMLDGQNQYKAEGHGLQVQ